MSMLNVTDLHKTFNAGTALEHKVLKGLNLSVEEGEFVCIIGSNGAGKSTLFNAISGSFECERGTIELDGKDITFMKEHKRAHEISRVFQDPLRGTAPHLTVAENIALAYLRSQRKPLSFATSKKRKQLIRDRITSLDLGLGLEDKLDTQVGSLSGGQRQVITLLMATICTPKLLLLDEHTAALDPATAAQVLELTEKVVREQHLATLMVTHSLSQALSCGDRTVMLDGGKVAFDLCGEERARMTPADLMAKYQNATGTALDSDELVFSAAQ